jgi:hypothetical protein
MHIDGYGVADGRFGDPAEASGTVTQRGRLGPSQAIATGPTQAVIPTAWLAHAVAGELDEAFGRRGELRSAVHDGHGP